jgi:glycosyltransferase involved in cell wall biosynthesis
MKLLFVNHSLNLGGSTRSLRELIANYRDVEIDLVVPHLDRSMPMDDVRTYFGPHVQNVYRKWLPFELCYRGRSSLLRAGHRWAFFAAAWRLQRYAFYRFAKSYDAIHLNSVVLHPMVSANLPFIVHVREIIELDVARVKRNVAKAHGVIFIDEAARAPFRDVALKKSVVINNAVDMTRVGAPEPDPRLGGDPAKLTIFAMIGLLIPEKGVDRVIRAFRGTSQPDARLLIVGRGEQEAELRRLARNDDRIVFWGVETQIERVYALADYVLRGEAYPCVGRTIYEALYAGCAVIIPGAVTDHTLFEYERFAPRVHFYPPGDEARLREVFAGLTRKVEDKRGESNVAGHVAAFDAFVREAT